MKYKPDLLSTDPEDKQIHTGLPLQDQKELFAQYFTKLKAVLAFFQNNPNFSDLQRGHTRVSAEL